MMIQFVEDDNSKTYLDFESVEAALEGRLLFGWV